jgi:ABC-type multidrug transport system ATPase subunit
MIKVERLTRRYSSVKAVDGVSFSIGRGEIVGLLGLNGAGKTTAMRMLTTFLPGSRGGWWASQSSTHPTFMSTATALG